MRRSRSVLFVLFAGVTLVACGGQKPASNADSSASAAAASMDSAKSSIGAVADSQAHEMGSTADSLRDEKDHREDSVRRPMPDTLKKP